MIEEYGRRTEAGPISDTTAGAEMPVASTPVSSAEQDTRFVPGDQPRAQTTTKPASHMAQRKRKRSNSILVRAIIWFVVLVLVLVLAVVVSAYIAGFNSVWDMLNWISTHVMSRPA